MAATYMLRKYLRSQEAAERPEAVHERAIRNEAAKRASADRKAAFPKITPENFEAADQYQSEREAEWARRLSSE